MKRPQRQPEPKTHPKLVPIREYLNAYHSGNRTLLRQLHNKKSPVTDSEVYTRLRDLHDELTQHVKDNRFKGEHLTDALQTLEEIMEVRGTLSSEDARRTMKR